MGRDRVASRSRPIDPAAAMAAAIAASNGGGASPAAARVSVDYAPSKGQGSKTLADQFLTFEIT